VNWDSFLDQLAGWLKRRGLLTPGARWVVGVSGGPDSTLLLHAFKALGERSEWRWALHAAHFHHGLRGAEADADEQFVAALADRLGVAFHAERADIRARSQAEGGSTEEVARRYRYEFLERVALKTGSAGVAVGHNADDNAETLLHRICRGTGLRGLAGIADVRAIRPGSRVRLVRPWLPHRRAVIEALCAARGFETRVDTTNVCAEFTRNRIRHVVLPMLRDTLNPSIVEALLRLAEQARWVGSYFEEAAARTFDSLLVSDTPGHIVLNTPALLAKHRAIQAEVVRRAIALVLGGEQELSYAHIDAALRLAADPASGKELHLPGPVVVGKRYDRLEFHPLEDAEPAPELGSLPVACPGCTPLPVLGAELVAELRDVDASRIGELRSTPHPNEAWLDYDQVRPPLLVRGRRPGERFHPLGAPGPKSISDFLIDEKVEPAARARTALLCDQDGPLWVMPLRIDERAKLREESRRALRLVLRPASAHHTGSP
jgi:tRNA(Ile)-lysidine synthase